MPIRYPDPPGYVPDVMTKVYRALEDAGLEDREVLDAISAMQNEGVLFRERGDRFDGGDAKTILSIVFQWMDEQNGPLPDHTELLDRLRRSGYCGCTTKYGCAACGGKEELKEDIQMAYTSHGHAIPGSPTEKGPKPDATRCGGLTVCPRCRAEVKEFHDLYNVSVTPKDTAVPMNVPDDFVAQAKRLLIDYVDSHYSTEFEKPVFEVYVVWFVKVLQHWKALVATDRPDGKYYEITFNGDKGEAYIDEYQKIKNTTVRI